MNAGVRMFGAGPVVILAATCRQAEVCVGNLAASPEDRSPIFLALLDTDKPRAWDEFSRFFLRAMAAALPRNIHLFPRDDHDDLLQDLLLAFVKRDFAKLRQYRDQGKPFVGWMYFVGNKLLIDMKKRRDAEPANIASEIIDPGRFEPKVTPSRTSLSARLEQAVRTALESLEAYCKTLLAAAIQDGLKPREIAILLGMPAGDNVAISNKVRSCLDSLRRRLRDAGYGPEEVRLNVDF